MQQRKKLNPAIASLIIIVVVGIVTSVAIVVKNAEDTELASSSATTQATTASSSTTDVATSAESSTTDTVATSGYQDGTYSATASYLTPGGRESIDVTVTIADGIITEVSVTQDANDRESQQYQNRFANSYSSIVKGKAVDSVSLSRVAGASLTTIGFNDALDQIKSDAAV